MSRALRVVVLSLPLSLLGLGSCVVGGPSQPPESPGTYGTPPGGPGTIHVIGGTYGASCGQPRGNVTAHLSTFCEGRDQRCSYRVDYRVLGDPAYGCQKDYFAEWTCGSAPEVFQAALPPEAGLGAVIELSCPPTGPAAPNAPAMPPPLASPPDVAPPPPVPSPPPSPPPISEPPAPPPVAAPSAPPVGTTAIHVLAGSYGLNCRAARGNTTAHLYRSCEGQPECAYRVDYRVIGDPAYGCRKDYLAEWTCGGDPTVRRAGAPPEAGFGALVTLSCRMPAVAAPPPAPPAPPPAPPVVLRRHPRFGGLTPPPPPALIHVVAGSYGMNCRAAHGNVTAHLHQACDGRAECAYRIDYKVIGDPAYGCQKDYVAEWTCGANPQIHQAVAPPEAGLGSVMAISCP